MRLTMEHICTCQRDIWKNSLSSWNATKKRKRRRLGRSCENLQTRRDTKGTSFPELIGSTTRGGGTGSLRGKASTAFCGEWRTRSKPIGFGASSRSCPRSSLFPKKSQEWVLSPATLGRIPPWTFLKLYQRSVVQTTTR